MARHLAITDMLGAPVYFCDSRSPWQRGTNENTNGLLRDYFPKGTDLSSHSPGHLLAVENELNHRPRHRPQRPHPGRAIRRAASVQPSVGVATLSRTRCATTDQFSSAVDSPYVECLAPRALTRSVLSVPAGGGIWMTD